MTETNDFKPHFQQTSNSWVEFYQHCEVDPVATKQAGHKVYRDVDFALMVSKSGTRKVPMKATDDHKKQFPIAWDAYLRRRELEQTHLGVIGLRPSQMKDLERSGIKCLEDLADKSIADEYYVPYSDVARQIIKLREQNDQEVRSNQHVHQERQEVPRSQNQQHIDIGAVGPSQETPHQEIQGLTYEFNL